MVLTRRLPRARTGEDAGLVAVLVAVVLVGVVMPVLALVVDLGLSRTATARARTTADAVALAAAAAHSDAAAAIAAAHRIAADALGVTEQDWASCLDPQPLPAGTAGTTGDCVSFDPAAKQVRVRLPSRRVPSVFAGLLGEAPPAATATSVATWGAFGPPCTLCVPGSYDGGAQQLEVHGGDVAVGGDLTVLTGAGLITDPGRALTVGGRATVTGTTTVPPAPGAVPGDPYATSLAALAALPQASPTAVAASSAGTTCSPGTYQDVSDCTTFAPGVYVVTGRPLLRPLRWTVTLHGGGTGVVLYVTCSTPWWVSPVRPAPCSGAQTEQPRINFAAGAPGLTLGGHPGYGGLALAFDPSSDLTVANTNQRFSGTGTLTVNGGIDGPAVVLREPSTGNDGRLVVQGGRLVVGRVAYGGILPVPPHPYVTVQAPAQQQLADGPVRLVPPAS